MKEYEIQAEVGAGVCLPDAKKYTIRIQIADFCIETKGPKEKKPSYNRWSERFESVKFQCPYSSVEELDRVYFYLMDGSMPICFWRGNAVDFLDRNPKYAWYPLTNDLAIGKVQNAYDAGMIQIKLSINDLQKNPPVVWNQYPTWREKAPKRLTPMKVRCYIFQCKDLPSADTDGTSDPYISVWNPDNIEAKTDVVEDNLNPIYYQAVDVGYEFHKRDDAPPIILNLLDQDTGLLDATDDFLGRAVIKLEDAAVADLTALGRQGIEKPPRPKWHYIRAGFHESLPACGEVLCSFALLADDREFKPIAELKLSDEVRTKEFNINIHVLGLRELESFGIMPIKKAYIKFNVRSLLPPERAHAVENIKTEPKATGKNPNINAGIAF